MGVYNAPAIANNTTLLHFVVVVFCFFLTSPAWQHRIASEGKSEEAIGTSYEYLKFYEKIVTLLIAYLSASDCKASAAHLEEYEHILFLNCCIIIWFMQFK